MKSAKSFGFAVVVAQLEVLRNPILNSKQI